MTSGEGFPTPHHDPCSHELLERGSLVVPAAVSCSVQPPAVPALHLTLDPPRSPRPASFGQQQPSKAAPPPHFCCPLSSLKPCSLSYSGPTPFLACLHAAADRFNPIQLHTHRPTPRVCRETTTTHRSLVATNGYICSTSRHRAQHSCGGVCLCDSHTCKAVVFCARASHRSTLSASPRLASVECVTVLLVAAATDC